MENRYDSIILISFGGPEKREDVMPFLKNVTRGRNIPERRLQEVAEHYYHFGGKSPINEQNRELIRALEVELKKHAIDLPIYFGNRNWQPTIEEALKEMIADGRKRALAFFTSMFSSYSGCRQYQENISDAQKAIGDQAPVVEKLRFGYNHPLFIEALTDRTKEALNEIPAELHGSTAMLFSAHSIPLAMAKNCEYVNQLNESAALVAENFPGIKHELVYQSRSGPPEMPWLEPDICDRINQLASDGIKACLVVPIGFVSDHLEVLYDLDVEAREAAENNGLKFSRAKTVENHPLFVSMIRELIEERLNPEKEKRFLGSKGPHHDYCPESCCLSGRPRPA
ncbi:MAG: ferrochelatase [Candidatus Dadabacteria bacterium]|nr:MAG: ferrochelatase [Candidatus Dadabacteria bacterium]